MTDTLPRKYAPLVKRIRELIAEWEPRLDLPGVDVDHRFHDGFMDETNDMRTGAQTVTRWEYRFATIHWYLPSLIRLDDADLETTVVHEFCHVLLAPIEMNMANRHAEHCEFAVESVARAIIKTHKERK